MYFYTGIVFMVIACLISLACVAIGIAYFSMARQLTRRMRETLGEMETVLAESLEAMRDLESRRDSEQQVVPPMRIALEPLANLSSGGSGVGNVDRIASWLVQHSFDFVGDFEIHPLGEQLKLYLSDDRLLVAAIRMPSVNDVGHVQTSYVEFCCDLGNGQRAGVCNPPNSTVPLDSEAIGKFYEGSVHEDFGLLSRMWLDAKDIVDRYSVIPVNRERITGFFEEAHAAEMDWRIATGGVSEREIRESFAAQGVEATREDIDAIQSHWQIEIENQLAKQSERCRRQMASGRAVLIVHEHCQVNHLLSRVRELLGELQMAQTDLESGIEELRTLLGRFSPRDAIARFRPLLPKPFRYDLVDQISDPIPADIYLFPTVNSR
ncbi:MAG: hypothetical protein KDB22_17570 [Planctomycetales bacterium]|nr:hypothetical protein [Planctomycetales bacterium]